MLESKVMRNTVLIVKNITHEGPGLLETTLLERGIASVSVNLAAGELFADPRQFGAVVVLGGPQSAKMKPLPCSFSLGKLSRYCMKRYPISAYASACR